jgi:hypothetical protein
MRDPRLRVVLLAGAAIGVAVVVLAILVIGFGARLDARRSPSRSSPRRWCTRSASSTRWSGRCPGPTASPRSGQAAGSFTQAELRDEKRRLLRAIKELEFDFGMGKLSKGDFDNVIATYRLRAIEVMRALEGGATLHPELASCSPSARRPARARRDAGRGRADTRAARSTTRRASAAAAAAPTRPTPASVNLCGTAMKKLDGTRSRRAQTPGRRRDRSGAMIARSCPADLVDRTCPRGQPVRCPCVAQGPMAGQPDPRAMSGLPRVDPQTEPARW